MRLTCPNCSAQYEVPDEVIPEEGRDVQCSNCEKTWFQPKHPEDTAPQAPEPVVEDTKSEEIEFQPEPAAKPQADPEPAAPTERSAATGNVDPAVANILKEEAARETELRAQEGGGLETQPDLALDTPPEPEKAVKDITTTETAADAGQKEALPDVTAINSSLLSEDPANQAEDAQSSPRKSGGGFLRGFALIVIIGIVLLLIYGNAQQISEAVPQADPILDSYVSIVDQARVWLEAQTSGATQN
ncbi:zinc-ribbon domain-containing protein [Ruegeria lacuscaerulensis]|uniref:zinc-ribbon domain-containing protein n=1 Tax=Ruegeria lacuscaerulensis TaxID=55218 RepID=UPI00147B2850|nr:zinc-ribbon domain-containing protein [Ruegeria lacuscaerulensis]